MTPDGLKPLEQWTLANGLRVLYQQDADFPLASATLILAAGSRKEKRSDAGLSSMTIDLLMQGTRKRNARAIARVMESVGASMGTQAHEDYAEMGFVVPATEIDRALDVMREVLHEPSFPPEEVVKEKAHVLASLESRRDAIFNLAYDHFNKALYGDHPYGRPLEGDVRAVRRFKRQDFRRWHREEIRPERGILSLITPLSAPAARARLRQSIDRWNPAVIAQRPHTVPSVVGLKKSHARVVPSSFAQAYLMVGWQAPGAKHADQVPLKVLNTLLGGGMSSRLFLTLREDLGLAYEVSSFYPTRLDRSQWVVYLGLPQEKLKLASQKLLEVLEKLADRGPSPAELLQANAMIRGAFLMDRQSHRRQAWYRAWWEFLQRGPDYGEEFLKAVDAVTAKTVQNLMRKILAQPRVTVTVVPK
jgi:predicted Zn-dependent peptidase